MGAKDYPDNFKMPFGKYKGKPFDEIPLSYLDWLHGQEFEEGKFTDLRTALNLYISDPAIQRELQNEQGE